METVVTIYELKENEDLARSTEVSEEWKAMVSEAGLEGQTSLLTKGTDGSESPVPYLWMNARLKNALKVLCPRSQDIEDYDKLPIPVIILGHVLQCQRKGYFKSIEVWYDDVKGYPW